MNQQDREKFIDYMTNPEKNGGASEVKGETVTRQATKEEEDYIWKFLAKLEKDGEV